MATLLQRQFANRAYWEKRERLAREEYMRSEEEQLAEIDMIYRDMYRWCEDEINRFYGKYADAEGISINEAKKRVAKEDVEAFKDLAKQYVKDKDFSDKANAELRLYNATMKINRLEMLKARIGLKLVDSTNEIEKYMGEKLTERAMAEFTRQAGILGSTVDRTETAARAKQIVNASFKNATFSERLWSHASNLRDEIGIQLQRGLISGAGSRKMAQDIKDKFGGNLNDAHRLMVTELRRVQTDVAMESYKAQGITQYEYMAVNPSACSVCKDINGKIYEVKKGEVGLNLPPMHPRCHCTTAPHINNAAYEAWLRHLESGGTTEEWDAMRKSAAYGEEGELKRPLSDVGDFGDVKPLDISEEERKQLQELYKRGKENGFENGFVIYTDGKVVECCSKNKSSVKMPIDDKNARGVKLFHNHTNDSIPSLGDMGRLLEESVGMIAAVTDNGEIYTLEIGYGIRPTIDELYDYADKITSELRDDLRRYPGYDEWTRDERMYMLFRERTRLIAGYYEWELKGGMLNE